MRIMLLMVSALLGLGGCFDGASSPDVEVPSPDAVRVDLDQAEIGEEINDPGGLPDLTGTVYLATELIATEPTDTLNEAWAAMVADYTLAIAFVVVDHDVATQTMELDLASAWVDRSLAEDGSVEPLAYRFALEPVRLKLHFDGLEFSISGIFAIDLVPMAVNKPFHVHGAVGSGRFSEDGQQIAELRLEGFLAEEQMVDFCLLMPGLGSVNFRWFMNLAHICATTDSDEDGTADSYLFKGFVKASADDEGLFEPGIEPIAPLISTCKLDTEDCVPQ